MIPEFCPCDGHLTSPMKCGGCKYENLGDCEYKQVKNDKSDN